jgi:hypothetical protein
MTDQICIADAAPENTRNPDPTASELALAAAARSYDQTASAIEQHDGPRSGEAYEAKILAWRDSIRAIREAAREYVKEHPADLE